MRASARGAAGVARRRGAKRAGVMRDARHAAKVRMCAKVASPGTACAPVRRRACGGVWCAAGGTRGSARAGEGVLRYVDTTPRRTVSPNATTSSNVSPVHAEIIYVHGVR